MSRNRKGIAVKQLILIILALLIAFVVAYPSMKKMFTATGVMSSIGPSECTDADITRKIGDFRSLIETYSQEYRPGETTPNDRYSLQDAKEMFRKYMACRQKGMFNPTEIAANDEAIKKTGQTVYIKMAEALCKEIDTATKASAKQEVKDLYKKYDELAKEYDSIFSKEFSGASGC